MEKQIKEYLLQNKKLTIGNFGTFEVVYKPSQIHPILHTFTVPGNYVVFTEDAIMLGDEFVDYVSKQENITKEEAANLINLWIVEIRETIASKKEYSLSTLGKFVLNAMNKIEFVPSLDTDISPESLGLEDFTVEIPAISKKEIKPETLVEKIEEKIKETPPIVSDIKEEDERIEKEDTTEDIEEIEDGFTDEKPKKRRRPVLVLLVTLLVLLVCSALTIGVTYYFYPQTLKNNFEPLYTFIQGNVNISEEKEPVVEEVATIVEIITQEEDIAIMEDQYIQPELGYVEEISNETQTETIEEPVENVPAVEKPQAVQAGNYYVVIGSFKENANAETFLAKKQSEYSNVVNLGLGKSSQLYLIAIGPYSQDEAKRQIDNGVKGWVLKK